MTQTKAKRQQTRSRQNAMTKQRSSVEAKMDKATSVMSATPALMRIRNSELVASLTNAGTAFQHLGLSNDIPGYDLNPGNALVFPWLSGIALGFERYRFKAVKFRIVSGAASTTSGRLYLAFDYDYNDSPPSNVTEFAQTSGSVSGNVRNGLSLTLNTSTLNADLSSRYVSRPNSLNGVEPRTVYAGFLCVACSGVTVNTTFDLMVDYDVELLTPQPTTTSFDDDLSAAALTPFSASTSYALPQPNGTMPKIVPGIGGIPSLAGGPVAPTWAYDVRPLVKGLMTITSKHAAVVGTPAAVADNAYLNAYAWDSLGAFLGGVSAIPSINFGANLSSTNPANDAVAGSEMISKFVFRIKELRDLFPTVSFVVPAVVNAAIKAAETTLTTQVGVKLEL